MKLNCDFNVWPNILKIPSHTPTLICCDFLDAYSDGCVKFTSEQCFQPYVFSTNCDFFLINMHLKLWSYLL